MLNALREPLRRYVMMGRFLLPLRWQRHHGCNDQALRNPEVLDLAAIAYNNPEAVSEQWRLISETFREPHMYTVIDNSLDPKNRQAISDFCRSNHIGYIGLPPNPYSGQDPSMSHAVALNWAYRHFLKPRKANYVGFLDHDILPIRPRPIGAKLDQQGIYGLRQDRGDTWYLWPGYCFYRRSWIHDKQLDFRPRSPLDTGGANAAFYTADPTALQWPHQEWPRQGIEFIDGWVHVMSSGGWRKGAKVSNLEEAITYARNHLS